MSGQLFPSIWSTPPQGDSPASYYQTPDESTPTTTETPRIETPRQNIEARISQDGKNRWLSDKI